MSAAETELKDFMWLCVTEHRTFFVAAGPNEAAHVAIMAGMHDMETLRRTFQDRDGRSTSVLVSAAPRHTEDAKAE